MRPSQRFTEWLDRQLTARKPGARLPTTVQLARSWALSPITVSRILDRYHKQGLIVRIPRRGTFVAPLEEPRMPAPPGPSSSLDTVVDAVKQSITSGALRKGDALPSVKFMSRQFSVAPRTVIAAYRRLESQTHVSRVGKTYWVGSFPSLVKYRQGSEVHVLKAPPADYTPLFLGNEMGLAFRTMDKELQDHGLVVHYDSFDSVARLVDSWRSGAHWPAGVMLAWLEEGDIDTVAPLVEALQRPRTKQRVPLLAVVDTADYRKLPRGTAMVSRGNLHTTIARTVVHYMTSTRTRRAYFFMEYNGSNLFEVFVPLKTRTELRSFDPSFSTRITVVAPPGHTRDGFLEEFRQHTVPDYRKDAIVGKYHYTPLPEVEAEIDVCGEGAVPFGQVPHGLWVFNSDRLAARALEWARSERLSVPGDIAVLSFENSPAYYHLGISACIPDWNTMGYLMAHALLGDITWERTGKGFMRIGAMIVHRRTTKPV